MSTIDSISPLALPTHSDSQQIVPRILVLTQADTDLHPLALAIEQLPQGFAEVRGASLNGFSHQQLSTSLDWLRGTSSIIIVRVLGNPAAFPWYQTIMDFAGRDDATLIFADAASAKCRFIVGTTTQARQALLAQHYLSSGGAWNFQQCLRFLSDELFQTSWSSLPPRELPQHGIYEPGNSAPLTLAEWLEHRDFAQPTIGVLFYRSHWVGENLKFIDAMISTIRVRGANALAVFTSSLKEPSEFQGDSVHWPAAFDFFVDPHSKTPLIDVLVTTTAHALHGTDNHQLPGREGSAFEALNVPVLQAIPCSASRDEWDGSGRGLSPLDTAMNVALPEFDGRLMTVPISFKEQQPWRSSPASLSVTRYQPADDRIHRVMGLALKIAMLKRRPASEKRIAIVLTNSPSKASRIGNGVGLDTPASLIHLLHQLRNAGYHVGDIPESGDALIHTLIDRGSYDMQVVTQAQLANAMIRVPVETYLEWFRDLPASQQQQMRQHWGDPPGSKFITDGHLALAGSQLGNVLIVLQPPRGYDLDADAIYHTPDIAPPHLYYALYRWLRDVWQTDALIHMGKHGTLEWLPGKSLGLSANCFPDSFLGDLPLFYPFIMNDPGEGSQAKRRTHATIIDHLVPSMTTADAYGPVAELTQLVDEYYQVELLDPDKLPLVSRRIRELVQTAHLDEDLQQIFKGRGTPFSSVSHLPDGEMTGLLEELDAYLCELTTAQIRGGLHILGQPPVQQQKVDLLQAITRVPNLEFPALEAELARFFGLEIQMLKQAPGGRMETSPKTLAVLADRPLVTNSDALETLQELSGHLLARLDEEEYSPLSIDGIVAETLRDIPISPDRPGMRDRPGMSGILRCLKFVCQSLSSALDRTTDEIKNILRGLSGEFIPAGPSGAPTRGMAHVLPSGRNFFSVDPRAVPSQTAWEVGQALADAVLKRHRNETGTDPESIGISVWGTAAMRTQGDDVAQILALMGVRPLWQAESRHLKGVELIPLAELGRPRMDVLIRISGFFRDAFPHLIKMLDDAVQLVANADEPIEQNFLRKHVLAEIEQAQEQSPGALKKSQAHYRIFGPKPGSYGAGILPLIDERNWETVQDFARVYLAWGGYAYSSTEFGASAQPALEQRLKMTQLALHNRDNREHDILDSDDYVQFHGGMIATIRALTGKSPQHYFGDTSDPSRPVVSDLKSEILRVFRTRVVNPKWLERIRSHGYKGALELNATVDYLFGYDATTGIVDDWMYEQLAEEYVFNPEMKEFLERSNPWALQAITERLLEAHQRGLWEQIDAETLSRLKQTQLSAETLLELRTESPQ